MRLSRRIVALLACGVSACVTQTTVPPRQGAEAESARSVTEFRAKPRKNAPFKTTDDLREERMDADSDALPPRGDTVADYAEAERDFTPSEPLAIPETELNGERGNIYPADPDRGGSRFGRARDVAGGELPPPGRDEIFRGTARRADRRDESYVEPENIYPARGPMRRSETRARDDVFPLPSHDGRDSAEAYAPQDRRGFGLGQSLDGAGTGRRWGTRPHADRRFVSSVSGVAAAADGRFPGEDEAHPRMAGEDKATFTRRLEDELFSDKRAAEEARASAMVLAAQDQRGRPADFPINQQDLPPPESRRDNDRNRMELRRQDDAREEAAERERQEAIRRDEAERERQEAKRHDQAERERQEAVRRDQAERERQEAKRRDQAERERQEARELEEAALREQREREEARNSAPVRRSSHAGGGNHPRTTWEQGEPGHPLPYVDKPAPSAKTLEEPAKRKSSDKPSLSGVPKPVVSERKETSPPRPAEKAASVPKETPKPRTDSAAVKPRAAGKNTSGSAEKPSAERVSVMPHEKPATKPKETVQPVVSTSKGTRSSSATSTSGTAKPSAGKEKPQGKPKPDVKKTEEDDAKNDKKSR